MIPAGDGGGQDFELNLASIIDCLTVIIAFLLMSSSFVSFGALDTAVAMPVAPAHVEPDSKAADARALTLTLRLQPGTPASVLWEVLSGENAKATERRTIARTELVSELEKAKARFPGLQGVVLSAEGRTTYQQLVAAMDDTRKVFPAVILGVQ